MEARGARRRALWLIGAIAIVGGILVPGALAATTIKQYGAILDPAEIAAGSTTTLTLSITNEADQQQLGSADLTAPPELTLPAQTDPTPSPTGSATIVGDTIRLRDLSLPPGATMSVSFEVTATCFAGAYTWSLGVKQANNFNGPPGNDFVPAPSEVALDTTVTGGCHLEFLSQPSDAVKNTDITDVAFDLTDADQVTDGSPVRVGLLDGADQVVTSFTGAVSVALNQVVGSGALTGSGIVDAVAGVATFPGLQVTSAGRYTLTASALSLSVTSDRDPSTPAHDPFMIVDDACGPDDTCSVSIPRFVQVDSTNTASSGLILLSLGVPDIDCGDDFQNAPYTTEIDATGSAASGTKTDTVRIFKQYVNEQPENGVAHYGVCYQAGYEFATYPGTDLVEGSDGTFTGWLPECVSQSPTPPCILSKNKNKAGDVVIVLLLPAGDPKHR